MSQFAFALQWERLDNEGSEPGLVTERARVFGAWLVRVGSNPSAMALAFVPDPGGRWDGEDFGEDDYACDEDDEDYDEDGDDDDDPDFDVDDEYEEDED